MHALIGRELCFIRELCLIIRELSSVYWRKSKIQTKNSVHPHWIVSKWRMSMRSLNFSLTESAYKIKVQCCFLYKFIKQIEQLHLCSVIKHLGIDKSTREVRRNTRLRLMFLPMLLSSLTVTPHRGIGVWGDHNICLCDMFICTTMTFYTVFMLEF